MPIPKGSKVLQLAAYTMLISTLENVSIFILFWLQSKVLHHLRIYIVWMVVIHSLHSIRHVWHVAYWKMTMNGGNVFRKLLIWQVVTNSETYLSPFFVIAPHLILWHYGWSLEFIFVMTFNMLSIPEILSVTLLRSKCLTMVFISLMAFSVVATSTLLSPPESIWTPLDSLQNIAKCIYWCGLESTHSTQVHSTPLEYSKVKLYIILHYFSSWVWKCDLSLIIVMLYVILQHILSWVWKYDLSLIIVMLYVIL